MKRYLIVFAVALLAIQGSAQQFKIAAIAFYNVENLFDTENDPKIRDDEFTPEGEKRWTEDKYQEKLDNLAKVISEMATEKTPDGPALIGLAEVENRKVLEDLVKRPAIANRGYQIVHYDSKDFRGIDVAMLYQEKYFTLSDSYSVPVDMVDEKGKKVFTRDILLVSGELDGQELHVLINHWPSRRGGQKASAHRRNASAKRNKELTDSLLLQNPKAGVIMMGDLNDDPNNESLTKYLDAKNTKEKALKTESYYNPFYDLFKKGIGTLAYRDSWSLFDQILVSSSLLKEEESQYYFYKAIVFNKPYLLQKSGQYKGYPFRTFDFDNYIGGYSDHLPTYIFLVKKVSQ
jgi:endonuclease/exonuclease/phosphatase family metal-dependent hydrolase